MTPQPKIDPEECKHDGGRAYLPMGWPENHRSYVYCEKCDKLLGDVHD